MMKETGFYRGTTQTNHATSYIQIKKPVGLVLKSYVNLVKT